MRDDSGLVGGRQDLRAERGGVRAIEHRATIDPLREEGRAALAAFLAGGPLEVEIGFGRGHFLAALAAAHPDTRFLAFETRTRWCASLLGLIDARGLDNVRVIQGDVRFFLAEGIPDGAIRALYLLFPDPWWKKRHHKRRLLAPSFLTRLRPKLRPGATVWVRSDVPMTIRLADEAFGAVPGFGRGDPALGAALPKTWRERRCERLGLPVQVRCYVWTSDRDDTTGPTDGAGPTSELGERGKRAGGNS